MVIVHFEADDVEKPSTQAISKKSFDALVQAASEISYPLRPRTALGPVAPEEIFEM